RIAMIHSIRLIPILIASLFSVYVGGTFIYGSFLNQFLSYRMISFEEGIAWFFLGTIFVLFSILHVIKFTTFADNNDEKTRMMFIESEESLWLRSAYGVLMCTLSGVSFFFLYLTYDPSNSYLEEVSIALLGISNLFMGLIKFKEVRTQVSRKRFVLHKS
ncbi:MAG: hypothetical protein AAF633_16120, partial [Chloroflexota bacterium]